MKTTNLSMRLLSAACLLLAGVGLPAHATQIFNDDFESEFVGANPANPPWNIRVESGPATIEVTNTDLFGSLSHALAILNGAGNSSNNVRVGTTTTNRGVFQTYSFDLYDTDLGNEGNDGFFFRILTATANDVQSASINAIFNLGFADGAIGGVSGLYSVGQAQHIDIVANSGGTSVSYLGGAQTIDPFSADVWVDGQLVLSNFAALNTGPMGGMGFFIANTSRQNLIVDNVMKFEGADVQPVSHPAAVLLLMLGTVGLIARRSGGSAHLKRLAWQAPLTLQRHLIAYQ